VATNIARLLQSLDDDGNPANGINIHNNAPTAVDNALALGSVNLNDNAATFAANPAVVSMVANSGSTNTTLKAEATAQAHIVTTNKGRIVGAWQSTGPGGEFSYMIMFSDNTFVYGENDLAATLPGENGLEVGTYSYDTATGNVTFTISYDDNAPGTDSGVGDIGTPAVHSAVLSNGDATLTFDGTLAMNAIDFSASPLSGVWRVPSTGGAFEILLITDDGTIMLAENDLTATLPGQNGLEVGTYTYDTTTSNATVNLFYDDNHPGFDSGIGDIGTPAVIDAILSNSNNTLTVASGALTFTREF